MPSRLTRLNTRVLTSILLVALPVLLIGAGVVIGIGRNRQSAAESAQLTRVADYTASAIDAYVYRRILDASLLARVPDIRRAAAEGNAVPYDAARVGDLDKNWQGGARTGAAQTLLTSAASRFLVDLVKNDSIYREVLVTDRHGRLVAASNVTSDYFQADEGWWINAFDGGRGRVNVSDVRRDDSARVYAFEIAVPVPAPNSDETAGVMKIVADSREMLTGIAGLDLGATTDATLVRTDGSIVYRRQPFNEGERFFGAELLRGRLDDLASRKEPIDRMTLEAQKSDGSRRLVAIAPSQLSRSFPELAWLVALSVDQDELAAPFRALVWYLALVFALTVLAVLAIALWLSMRLAAPAIDPAYDLHLVEHADSHHG
jgi:C4-dicarboxylate-specific signal transduction histidine kinase